MEYSNYDERKQDEETRSFSQMRVSYSTWQMLREGMGGHQL